MYGSKGLTKKELIDLINKNFKDVSPTETIAVMFFTGDVVEKENEIIMFMKKLND
ncbi:MAG: hypothetical protein J6T10_22845 [Methanobrevibacter sp.]|nr:hypothetical protein [Methanobrevibacter sp.]